MTYRKKRKESKPPFHSLQTQLGDQRSRWIWISGNFKSSSICRIEAPKSRIVYFSHLIWAGTWGWNQIWFPLLSAILPCAFNSVISPINISSTPGRCFLYGGSSLTSCQRDKEAAPHGWGKLAWNLAGDGWRTACGTMTVSIRPMFSYRTPLWTHLPDLRKLPRNFLLEQTLVLKLNLFLCSM